MFLPVAGVFSQESLLDMLGEEAEIEYAMATFKTNRVINLHSLENTHRGVLDIKIGHRFGLITGGFDNFFGLDNAVTRIGADYGLLEDLQIGLGRSTFQKTVDSYGKYRILRQSTGAVAMPLTLSILGSAAVRTDPWVINDQKVENKYRWFYTWQLIAGRKFSDFFSLQLSPGLVHRNLVETADLSNTTVHVGIGARFRLSRRVTLNTEWIYVLPDQIDDRFRNSLSIGLDIETGGHVFQLHFTNSLPMTEHGFINQSTGDWSKGDIHFGFNISRVFTIVKPETFR
ncbi:MAG: hypothetical protein EA409_00500 [Saprospirales bacterium]|nr:MAG: hypothetical protein EA409_00500 [Saprospirales bacterium]